MSPDAAEANFGGYKELVLDNLVIEKVTEEVTKEKLAALVAEAEEKYKEIDYRPEIWSSFQDVLKEAKAVLDKEGASQDEIEKAYYELKAAMVTMDNSAGIDATDDSKDLPKEQMTATAGSEQAQEGGEGPASNVLDGNADTIWHTVWAGTPIENHWLNLQLDKPATVSGLRLQQRSGRNGIIREAEIWVKKAGAADYEKVADASFGGTGWQAVAFEEVKDVTDVKLVPTATTGDEANKFSAAAEIRVMGRFQDEEVEVNKADLTALVEKAEVLKEKDYTSETWKPFAEALKEAQAVLAKEDASQAEVDAAQTSLQTAMDGLKKPGTTDNRTQEQRTIRTRVHRIKVRLFRRETRHPSLDGERQVSSDYLQRQRHFLREKDVVSNCVDRKARYKRRLQKPL